MSVQVKKRIEVLRTYLGRDTKGLELLELLKDEVTVLRKKLAATETALQAETTVKQQARERADAAELELGSMRIELHTLRQHTASVDRELATVVAQVVATNATDDDDDDDDDKSQSSEQAEIRAVLKELRKTMRFCPRAVQRLKSAPNLMVYDRESFAGGWSHKSMWTLGSTVALLTSILGQVTIVTDNQMLNMDVNDDSTMARHAVQWFSSNMSQQPNANQKMHAAGEFQPVGKHHYNY